MLSLCLLALLPVISKAELGLEIDGSLNKTEITNLYFDGDFDKVTHILESYRKSHPEMPDEDKIFIYKYLAVVYAANPSTVDKGEAYMYQMLKMVPSIELLDMYISDNIRAIFNNVKNEYQRLMSFRDSSETPQTSKSEEPKAENTETESDPAKPKSNAWIWWTAGGVGLAAVVTTFVLLSGDDDPGSKPLVIEN